MKNGMARRDFLARLGLAAGAFSLTGCSIIPGLRSRKRPFNFVMIFTDDQGWADVGCFGAKGFETPNLDRMAREGVRFTNFHVAQAVCSASRAGLMTGCYPNRIGIRGALGPGAKVGISDKEETIAQVLKKKDYTCAIFGKWHLGHHKKFLPLQHGFDEYLGLPYSNDMWPVWYDGRPAAQVKAKGAKWKAHYPPLPLIDGNEKVAEIKTLDDQATLTTRYTERAVSFIEKNKDKPFFLYLPHSMPHVPLGVSKKFAGKSKQGKYGDVIMEIDWSVGEILKTLNRFGLEKDTIVVFASDNGPWLNFGNHAGSVGPLREGKGTSWEGGKRTPCIMRCPGTIPAGKVCNGLASTIDILPTFAALAGAPLPKHKIDGVNIWSLVKDPASKSPMSHMFFYYHVRGKYDQLQAVYDGRFKLHFPHYYRSYKGETPGKDGFPGKTHQGHTDLALFDLKNDIHEEKDVKDLFPDVVAELEALGKKARADLGDKDLKGKGMREPGRVEPKKR